MPSAQRANETKAAAETRPRMSLFNILEQLTGQNRERRSFSDGSFVVVTSDVRLIRIVCPPWQSPKKFRALVSPVSVKRSGQHVICWKCTAVN